MPDEPTNYPLVFQRLHDDFKELDWATSMETAFNVQQPITTMMLEANMKGKCVVVMASLCDPTPFFPKAPDEPEAAPKD